MIRLSEMKNWEATEEENREAAKISELSSAKMDKY